jgi:hypothetical protein
MAEREERIPEEVLVRVGDGDGTHLGSREVGHEEMFAKWSVAVMAQDE